MSVRAQVVASYAAGSGYAPATWERITSNLANANLTPKGKPGGGTGAAHYQVGPIASVTMAAAATVPSEAADVVSQLEGLRTIKQSDLLTFASVDLLDVAKRVAVPVGTTLRCYLEGEILRWASPTAEMLSALATDRPWGSIWSLELVPSYPWASLSVHNPGQGWSHAYFTADLETQPRGLFTLTAARRKVELTLPILKIAGDLLRDTLDRQAAPLIPTSAPGSAGEDDATPETTKASGTGIHEGLRSEPPAPKAQTASSNMAHSATDKARKQRLSESVKPRVQVRHQLELTRNASHGSHWSHAAPA